MSGTTKGKKTSLLCRGGVYALGGRSSGSAQWFQLCCTKTEAQGLWGSFWFCSGHQGLLWLSSEVTPDCLLKDLVGNTEFWLDHSETPQIWLKPHWLGYLRPHWDSVDWLGDTSLLGKKPSNQPIKPHSWGSINELIYLDNFLLSHRVRFLISCLVLHVCLKPNNFKAAQIHGSE